MTEFAAIVFIKQNPFGFGVFDFSFLFFCISVSQDKSMDYGILLTFGYLDFISNDISENLTIFSQMETQTAI